MKKIAIFVCVLIFGLIPVMTHAQISSIESMPSSVSPDDDILHASITPDLRYVVFDSSATNLVAGDTNGVSDVFVYDRDSETIERVSIATAGTQANGGSSIPTISDDGRYVAYESSATNLVAGDSNGAIDIFVL